MRSSVEFKERVESMGISSLWVRRLTAEDDVIAGLGGLAAAERKGSRRTSRVGRNGTR
jgi:hypothetical protein